MGGMARVLDTGDSNAAEGANRAERDPPGWGPPRPGLTEAEAEAAAPGAFFAVTSNVDAHLLKAGFGAWEVRSSSGEVTALPTNVAASERGARQRGDVAVRATVQRAPLAGAGWRALLCGLGLHAGPAPHGFTGRRAGGAQCQARPLHGYVL
eukprot:8258035-Pyramimonas_sp.AAC.1